MIIVFLDNNIINCRKVVMNEIKKSNILKKKYIERFFKNIIIKVFLSIILIIV